MAVCGAGAVQAVDTVFSAAAGKPLAAFPAGRIVFGQWRPDAGQVEELVTHVDTSGNVYVHCHGGDAAVRAVMDSMLAAGAVEMGWRELLQRAAPRPFQAECEIALSLARTTRTAGILLDQHRGALQFAVQQCLSHIERGELAEAVAAVDALLQYRTAGAHLTQPFRVVLSGPPNAGKSSLMNALLGFQRSIVFDQPGTTRDALTAQTAIEGWPVELCDTAGIRQTSDQLEQQGVAKALQHAATADLVLHVQAADEDASRETSGSSESTFSGKQLHVISKADLADGQPVKPSAATIVTSVVTGDGIENLLRAIITTLLPQQPPPGAAVPFTKELIDALQQVRDALQADNPQAASTGLTDLMSRR